MDTFGIPKEHIFQSRNDSFYAGIMNVTKGKGVDFTLNSTAGDLLHKTFACLNRMGTHIEIGKTDLLHHGNFDMNMFLGGRTFAHFDLESLQDGVDCEPAAEYFHILYPAVFIILTNITDLWKNS